MKCTSFLYRAISLLLWITSCSCLHLQHLVPDDSQNHQKLGAVALDLWWQFHSKYCALACVLFVRNFCVSVSSSISMSVSVTIQAAGYPIHENTFCHLLSFYTVDWYFVTEEVLKWHDSICFKNPHGMKLGPWGPVTIQPRGTQYLKMLVVTH